MHWGYIFCIRSVEKDGSCHHSNQEKSFKIRERHYIYGIFLICRLNLQPNIQPSNADFHLPFNRDTRDWNLCWGMRKKFCVQKHESVGRDYIADCCDIRLPFNKLHRKSTKKLQTNAAVTSPFAKLLRNTKTPYGRTWKQIMTSRAVCTVSSLILSLKLSFCFYPSSHYFHKYSCDHPSASWIQSWILMFSYVTSIILKPHRYQNSVRRRL